MAVKVTIEGDLAPKEKSFPKLMRFGTLVVFFSQRGSGVCVSRHPGRDAPERLGDHSDNWPMDGFVDFNDPITLQNE